MMQVSGGCCKIARASVIVTEGYTKRTPSESSSIAEPCFSKLTIIKTVFDTSKIVFPAPARACVVEPSLVTW